MAKHICGVGGEEFASEQEYVDHVCTRTNLKATHPFHAMGPDFEEIQRGAVQRGKDRVEREKAEKPHGKPNA